MVKYVSVRTHFDSGAEAGLEDGPDKKQGTNQEAAARIRVKDSKNLYKVGEVEGKRSG